MVLIKGWAIKTSDSGKAILFVWIGDFCPRWLPRSQVEVVPGEWQDAVIIPRWLCAIHGLRPTPTPRREKVETDYNMDIDFPGIGVKTEEGSAFTAPPAQEPVKGAEHGTAERWS